MQEIAVRVRVLDNVGDERGSCFPVPEDWDKFLVSVRDLHIMTLRPNHKRGNHYHLERREILIVIYSDRWSLHWDRGAGTEIERRTFLGNGAALIEVEALASHAITNDGRSDIFLISMSKGKFDPEHPDTYRRVVV